MFAPQSEQSGAACLDAARQSLSWLLSQQREDGGWKPLENPPIDAFYKVAWPLSLMGEAAAAHRTLNYVEEHLFDADGDFSPRVHPWFKEVHHLYANAYVVIGAQKLERYGMVTRALDFLLSQQDRRHGGFYSMKTAVGDTNRCDTMSTGICGIACLATGEIEAAEAAASSLRRMIETQPAPQERFYTTVEADGELGTEFPSDQAFWRVIDTSQQDQCWYAVGLPFVLSILLHQATGAAAYAELADWFFDFQSRCVNPWDGGSSGKAAWGCSILYRLTGEERYRDIALHVAQNIVDCQTPDGWYQGMGGAGYTDGETKVFGPGDFDLAAEYTLWLGLIGSNLLAREQT